jgi:hypothetical protein
MAFVFVAMVFVGVFESGPMSGPIVTMRQAVHEMNRIARREDDTISVSDWQRAAETLEIDDIHVPVKLNLIYVGDESSVFDVVTDTQSPFPLVMVYRAFCPASRRPFSTTVTDYWFLKHLERTRLVPRVIKMSAALSVNALVKEFLPGEDIGASLSGDTAKRVKGKVRLLACPHALPEIRYILMEKIEGGSVASLIDDSKGQLVPQPVHRAMDLGLQMLRILEKLHSMNVVHGDPHFGNFLIEKGVVARMIDFERAKLFALLETDRPCRIAPDSLNMLIGRWNSPWVARDCPLSFRDDIYQFFIALAMMIHGEAYIGYVNLLSTPVMVDVGGESVKDPSATNAMLGLWKRHRFRGEIFDIPDSLTGIAQQHVPLRGRFHRVQSKFSLTDRIGVSDIASLVLDKFRSLERYVLSMGITDRPDYMFLKQTFGEIIRFTTQ